MGIGGKMEDNVQLQEFTERCLSYLFDKFINEDYDFIEEISENMGVTQNEILWMFEQLGYDRSDYVDENEEYGISFIDDTEKMFDFVEMSKEEFLQCHPDVSTKDYDATLDEYGEEGE
jgi:hypothetical protein